MLDRIHEVFELWKSRKVSKSCNRCNHSSKSLEKRQLTVMHLKSLFYVSFYHNPEVCCFVSFVLFALGLLAALFVWNASYFFPLFTHRASWVWTWYHVSHEILSKHACARGMIVHEVKWNIPIILFICQNLSKEYRLWTYLPKVVWLVNKGVNCIEMKGPGHLTSCSSMWSLCYVRLGLPSNLAILPIF